MHVSGHSYENDVFNSLLDGMSSDVVLNRKTAQKQDPNIDLNFTQTTSDDFNGVVSDELKFMADELMFAAKQANINLEGEDLRKFAEQSLNDGLRGKDLERAARKYCSNIERSNAAPRSGHTIATSEDLIQLSRISSVTPAGSPDGNMNNGKSGGYMGQSKNPNSIWDNEALARMAQVPENHQDKMGDEQIAQSRLSEEEYKLARKNEQWQEKQDKLSDKEMIRNTIQRNATMEVEDNPGNQNLPSNSMSMFSEDRDFNNIPDKTAGEQLKEDAENRSQKSANAKGEWNKVAASKKADNNANFLFEKEASETPTQSSVQRDKMDQVFEGLLNSIKG